jgi:threonine aldolase
VEVAAIVGKEAALYVPSGTMANQIAIHLHTRPGDGVLTEFNSHCYLYEAGAASALSGVQFVLLPLAARFDPAVVEAMAMPESLHYASTKLLVCENTHNRGAGRVLSPEQMDHIAAMADKKGWAKHCDGARLWNAAAHEGLPEKNFVRNFDSVAVCFSKGLGAPVGSAICGPKAFIERARKVRKRWGGGMRQAGVLAAAARYALANNRQRLREDHDRAAEFAKVGGALPGITSESAGTNMVYLRGEKVPDLVKHLAECRIKVGLLEPNMARAVFHLDIGDKEHQAALQALKSWAK